MLYIGKRFKYWLSYLYIEKSFVFTVNFTAMSGKEKKNNKNSGICKTHFASTNQK